MKTKTLKKSLGWYLRTLIVCCMGLVATGLAADQEIHLKAHNGQYVVAEEGGGREVNANRTAVGEWETFSLELVGGQPEASEDTRTVAIAAGALSFRPRRTRGDREFKGHGPKITADFTVYVSADRKKLMAKIRMKAQEWDADDGRPQRDYTTAEGEQDFVLYTVPGEGWRIFSFERPGVIGPTRKFTESRGYIDDDEEVDSFPGEKVVRWWHFTGDVHGDDAGVRTKVKIEYPAFRIKVG